MTGVVLLFDQFETEQSARILLAALNPEFSVDCPAQVTAADSLPATIVRLCNSDCKTLR
jgi:hypothetical protein